MHSTTLTTNTLTACYMNICCAAAAVSLWGMCVLWSRSAHIRPCFSGLFLKAFLGTVCACAVDGFIHWGYYGNEQPWGLHEHPTVQYKQHLSRDHNELWAKFSIEMLYDCRGMWENAVIWKPWICEFFGIPITNPDHDNLALFQRHSLPEYRCWPCPSL